MTGETKDEKGEERERERNTQREERDTERKREKEQEMGCMVPLKSRQFPTTPRDSRAQRMRRDIHF
jgi:hypothetical protein